MFSVTGHDNGLYFFYGRDDVARCDACGQLSRKWEEELRPVRGPRRLKLDVSTSYDGVGVVSQRFREVYEAAGLTGLRFLSIGARGFVVLADAVVEFDPVGRGTRFEKHCESCGTHGAVAGAYPVLLRGGSEAPGRGFARTDLEFGSDDEKSPVLVCGDEAAEVLRAATLRGLELGQVAVS